MFRNIVSPVQAWFLSQGRCVGCGVSLKEGVRTELISEEEEVTCSKCPRIYIYNKNTKRYRRAPLSQPK